MGLWEDGLGDMYIYPRRAYSPIVLTEIQSVNPTGKLS